MHWSNTQIAWHMGYSKLLLTTFSWAKTLQNIMALVVAGQKNRCSHRHCIKQRTRINETANQTNQLNVSRVSYANYSHTFLKSQLDDVPTSATTTAATEGETLLTQLTPKMNSPNDVACGTFFWCICTSFCCLSNSFSTFWCENIYICVNSNN